MTKGDPPGAKALALLESGAGQFDRSDGPVYACIERGLSSLILDHKLKPGDRLPGEHLLAKAFGVSRMTVRQALGNLSRRGLITRKVGRNGGTFVTNLKLDRDLRRFSGLSEQLRRHGMVAGAQLLEARRLSAGPEAAAALELERGAKLFEIRRLRLADGSPVALESSSFPAARFPGLLEADLSGSLYELLQSRYDQAPHQARERLEPVVADSEEAALLGVRKGAPLLFVERTAYEVGGAPIEFARDLFRGDRTRMVVWASDVEPPEQDRAAREQRVP